MRYFFSTNLDYYHYHDYDHHHHQFFLKLIEHKIIWFFSQEFPFFMTWLLAAFIIIIIILVIHFSIFFLLSLLISISINHRIIPLHIFVSITLEPNRTEKNEIKIIDCKKKKIKLLEIIIGSSMEPTNNNNNTGCWIFLLWLKDWWHTYEMKWNGMKNENWISQKK